MAFLPHDELQKMGFNSVGENVFISDRASFYNCKNISIGSNVRIDDFCVISAGQGGISIGNFVHLAVFSSLIGQGHIQFDDFSGISSRVSIYSSNDDYSGTWLTNPTVPKEYTNVSDADVYIGRHAIIGSGSIILPGVKIAEGVAIGALSLVKKNCTEFGIYFGIPAKKIGTRKANFLQLEKDLLGL